MVKKKYAGEKEILDKIKALFSYRKLTDLIHKAGLDKVPGFVDQLTEIQYRIYLLDAYLESDWTLDEEKLMRLWEDIRKPLDEMVQSPEETEQLLREIREYERIERNCRNNTWPTREPFRKFYTIKSCDVRLIRNLIYRARPELQAVWHQKAWACYDLITEVNDDVADLQEDLRTYNGNRFLISLLRKGNKKTAKRYRKQLLSITDRAKKYFRKKSRVGDHQQLLEWTLARSAETLELLESTMHKNDHSIYTSSLMLDKMK
jgi:hypothetical protein